MNPIDKVDDGGAAAPATAAGDGGATCHCGAAAPAQFVYAVGKLDLRFPSLGVEREFQQREREHSLQQDGPASSRGKRLQSVLAANSHIAHAVCYVQSIGGTPAYAVAPASREVLHSMLASIGGADEEGMWTLVIGRAGPIAPPTSCGGLLVQMVAADACYAFTLDDFVAALTVRARLMLEQKGFPADRFDDLSRQLFRRIVLSLENLGALDAHRAVNYVLMQHPGPFIAMAERAGSAVLDNIETRIHENAGGRRIVSVIFTFANLASGIPERLFTRVDVTEEWPFVVDTFIGRSAPIGLHPFIDSAPFGAGAGSAF